MTEYCGEAKHMDTGVQSEAMKRDGCYMDSSGSTNSRRARQGSFEPVRPPKLQNLQAGECWAWWMTINTLYATPPSGTSHSIILIKYSAHRKTEHVCLWKAAGKRPAWKVIFDQFLVSLKYQQLGQRMEGKWENIKEKALDSIKKYSDRVT